MSKRRIVAAILLAVGATFLAAQTPVDLAAQDAAKVQKKGANKKKADFNDTTPLPAPEKPANRTSLETRPSNPMNVQAVAAFIDSEIDKQLNAAKIASSPRSSDAEFIRRAALDITGTIPSADRVEAFLGDSSSDKRAKLVDELLASPRFGQRLADIWVNQMMPTELANRFLVKKPLNEFMIESFNANKPWDRLAFELLTASGEQDKNGAVTYFMGNQGVDKMTDSVGKLFLGVQIQCAQCHNHPFTHWKQTEYWGLAQFFYNVNVAVVRNNKDTTTVPGVSETARPNRRGNPLPDSAKTVPAKFLGGETVKLSRDKAARPVLADWVCTAENPFFSKSMVNRVWAQYFGRGLVNPIDDLSDENEPTHPDLLKGLAKEFSAGGFDIKSLVRAICLSNAYQRTSQPTGDNKSDIALYSHMAIKVLAPEQLFDSLGVVVGSITEGGKGFGKGMTGAPKGGGNLTPRDRFAAFFAGSENAKATDYETGIPQALRLMNNPRLSGSPNLLNELVRSGKQPAKVVDRLYLMTVSRKPTDAEVKRLTDYIAKAPDAKAACSDIMWALLNSSEFALNH
jgi:Protein of unknown function (DUF1549)/Protein of unknown function (DUF1553)